MSEKNTKVRNKNSLKRKKRRRMRTKLFFRRLAVVFMVALLAAYGFVGLKVLDYARELLSGKPTLKINDFISEESTKIYDSEGKLITEVGTYFRDNLKYNNCPEALIDAFLSIEDSRYFEHNGFDIPRFSKAAVETLLNRNTQGGSTFTMQLVKNTYFTIDAGDDSVSYDASYEYKAQQIWLSMELEQYLNKKEIFELYVNKLNFGDRVRGAEKASQYYYNKHVNELNLTESAMLAGIINLPNQYNPYRYLEDATKRRNDVLALMLRHGYINQDEYNLAISINVEDLLVGEDSINVESTKYPAYVDAVLEEAQYLTGYDPVFKGMEIYTGLIKEFQEKIELISSDEGNIPYTTELMQTAICTMNNHDGTIVGISGGRNYSGNGSRLLNRATQQYKQPGSCLKPIIPYALGFEYLGYSLDEILDDRPITYPGESRVLSNAGGGYHGDVTIRDAHIYSYNIPAILTLENVLNKVGPSPIVDYIKSLGFTTVNDQNFHLSVAIGSNEFEATVKQVAGAHSAIMNLGIYNEPHTITRLELTDGTTYYPNNQNVRVISPGSAYLVTQLMKGNVDTTVWNFTHELKRDFPVYAKTGTSDWGTDGLQYGIPEGAMKDKWMVASTSKFTTAVWLGYDMAVAGKNTYINNYEMMLNLTGRIQNEVLDVQEELYYDELLDGVQAPPDVVDLTYVRGTIPHVQPESWMPYSSFITSQVSQTGLQNQPLISAAEYASGDLVLNGIGARISEDGSLRISWSTNKGGCSGGIKDISLIDEKNNVQATGTCLVDNSWLISGAAGRYIAEIYVNGVYVTSIVTSYPSYFGRPIEIEGSVRVCGYFTNGGSSDKRCTNAGSFSYSKYEEEKREKEEAERREQEEREREEREQEERERQEREKEQQQNNPTPAPTPVATPEATPVPTPEPTPVVPDNDSANQNDDDSQENAG